MPAITAYPRTFKLVAQPRTLGETTVLHQYRNWVTDAGVEIVTDTGANILFKVAIGSAKPFNLVAIPKRLGITARSE